MKAARLWIRLSSLLVPWDERGEWIEEWHAELAATDGRLFHALGALPDAWYLRTEGWTMEGLFRDIRMAMRTLVRKPLFTALAGITLAVGIGANTAIYSVVDGILLDPLPFPNPHELVSVNHTAPGLNIPVMPHSEGFYLRYQEGLRSLKSFAVFSDATVTLITEGDPKRLVAAEVTQQFFEVGGVNPIHGRGFVVGEDRIGAEPVAVLSHRIWQQDFGSDPEVVGRLVEMSGIRRRIVGILPEGVDFPSETEVWIPLAIDETQPEVGNLRYLGLGRLADGATVSTVNSEMSDILFRLADENPDELSRDVIEQIGLAPDVKPLRDLYVADVAQALWVLLGTVGFVLLIACANVANLFLVRAEARQREQALRTALGASRADMTRQYLTESIGLAAVSGLLGLGLAVLGLKALLALAPVDLPLSGEIGIDGSVLLFTAIISVGSGLLFGLFPVVGYARKDLSGALKEGGRSSTSGRERHRTRNVLVVAQVALALVLLVGSGLMARSFAELRSIDPGFDPEGRLAFRVALPEAEYSDGPAVVAFYRQLHERVSAIPGVRSAAVISAIPLEDNKSAGPMVAEGQPTPEGALGPMVDRRRTSPGYFQAMGIPLVEGRELSWEDGGDAVRSVVVSETLARTFWPNESSVLGRRILHQGHQEEAWEIVGVAADVRFESLSEDPAPLAYFPLVTGTPDEPDPERTAAVVLHASGDPLGFVPAAREALREVGPRIPMVDPRTAESVYKAATASTSFTVVLLGIASAIAMILGTVGIYGVISYVVTRRTSEIGVRMALGAPGVVVLRSVVTQGLVLTGVGIGLGLLGAWGLSRVLSSLLYGVSATDPLTYLGTAAGLAAVAFLASWIPARRAAAIDPVEALRSE